MVNTDGKGIRQVVSESVYLQVADPDKDMVSMQADNIQDGT